MACSCAGLVSLIVLFVAVALNIVAFSLPLWTTSTTVNESLQSTLDSSDFAAGYDVTEVDSSLMANFSDYSVCDGYSRAGDVSEETQLSYATMLATTAGMDPTQFNKFLDKSCGALGSATLAFGGISMSAGALSFVALTLGITCCKKRSIFVLGGKVFVGIAQVTAILMFVLWVPQARPLSKADDVTLNGSFVLAVVRSALYIIASLLVSRHVMKGK
ncbi:hypothetical protein PInf_007247 [Phytophthora infestans]|nr:hypothetical protein PInf_007247 [Phytophthora infestans]